MSKDLELAETLWDKHSRFIGEDISSLEEVAATDVMKQSDFYKAAKELFHHGEAVKLLREYLQSESISLAEFEIRGLELLASLDAETKNETT